MFSWINNLGKKRSELGRFLDNEGITQFELEEKANLSRGIISKLCNDRDYVPKYSTGSKIIKALNRMGYDVDYDDFWDI